MFFFQAFAGLQNVIGLDACDLDFIHKSLLILPNQTFSSKPVLS